MQPHSSTHPTQNQRPIFAGTRIVGSIAGDTFRKVVSGSRHFMRHPPGIGSDVSSLEDAARAGALWMQVIDRETGNVFTARIATVYEKGIEKDYGFGKQLLLPFRYWRVSRRADQPADQLELFQAPGATV